LGFGVWDLGYRGTGVQGYRVWGSWFGVQGLGCGVRGVGSTGAKVLLGFEVWDLEFGVQGTGYRVQGLGFGVWEVLEPECYVPVVDLQRSLPHRSVQFSIQEELLHSNEKRFRGGLVCKARRLVYHSTLGRE